MIDPHRARQVARNLILNAIKYTPPGGHVMVSVSPGADQIVLRVRDTGIGIAEEEIEHIWERYYRVGQSVGARYISSQGLGLAIVRIIVRDLGGTLDVESALGEGSTFIIGFPRADRPPQH
jgi:two-component system phosphate regulon sensor histidine kinase PhoR